ncbi:glycosyltransferase family 9 protein [Fibrobacterota bacterium]
MTNILFILPHNSGDVIMGLSVLSRVRKAWPDAEIDYVVGEECRELVEHHPYLRQVFVIPSMEIKKNWNDSRFTEMLEVTESFISGITKSKYQLSINLFQERFGALIHGLTNSEKKVGYTFEQGSHYRVVNRYMEHLFATPVSRKHNPWHVVDISLRALDLASPQVPEAVFPPLPELSSHLSEEAADGWVFQIGSAWIGKRWPVKQWAVLAGLIVPHIKSISFVGASVEQNLYDELMQQLSEGVREKYSHRFNNLIGKTSLLESLHIIKKARWLITGDTVAMHMGAAAKTRTLALFGASNPVETGPYGPGNFVFQASTEVPETLPLKKTNPGLEKINPEQVANFLLKGKLPEGLRVWETVWDPEKAMQVLINHKQECHPFQDKADSMQIALSHRQERNKKALLTETVAASFHQLDKCMLNPGKQDLLKLEGLDHKLEEETRSSVIWEAYRVAINGLSLDNIRGYLRARKARMVQALEEEATLGLARE